MSFWSFASLREPVESIQVGDSVSCFTVLPETGGILAADDHGGLYMIGGSSSAPTSTSSAGPSSTGNSSSSTAAASASSSRKQIRKLVTQESSDLGGSGAGVAGGLGGSAGGEAGSGIGHHFGVVTALSAKVFKGSASAAAYSRTSTGLLRGSGGLVLSAGVDWTIKLWAPAYAVAAAQSGGGSGGGGGGQPSSSGTASRQQQPLMPLWSATSHSYDYMSDVKWSPVHPGLFATASSNGTLGLWNLASSLDDPLTGPEGLSLVDGPSSSTSSSDAATTTTPPPRGLNKVRWSGDGRRLAVAAGDVMQVLTLHEEVARPKGDEDDRIMSSLVSRGLIARQ